MSHSDYYFTKLAAAFVRGKVSQGISVDLPGPLRSRPLESLSPEDCEAVFCRGAESGLKLHKFKRTMGLARVRRVFGVLNSLAPADLLDVGSGRGASLWPLLEVFPNLPVTAIDRSARRADDLQAVRLGGVQRLSAMRANATALPFKNDSFDVVTLLEVLEHIPDAAKAVAEAVRVARRSVVLSVPSKEDDNPEHVHLFDQARLRNLFEGAGRVNFDYVPGHLIAMARVQP
jgi:SAM-dependent methyltransferase